MELTIKTTPVFTKNWDALNNKSIRFLVNQGGGRSSKTTSILQCLIIWSLQNEGKVISIVRKTLNSLKGSVIRDFINLLQEYEIYEDSMWNKSEAIYRFHNGTMVEFFGADNDQKLRGRKRDIAWLNEANEMDLEEYTQINMRCSYKMIFDFNPSEDTYITEFVLPREDALLIKSTYKDNPFLEQSLVDEMDYLINVDENYYRVYALGERSIRSVRVFTHFQLCNEIPKSDDFCYGLDLGFNDPCVLVKTYLIDGKIYTEELLYQSGLTTQDLIKKLEELNISKRHKIYSDHRPEVIEEIKRAGWNIHIAEKSILPGIDYLKSKEVFIKWDSENIIKEMKLYSWKVGKDNMISDDEIVDVFNHAMDALRYSAYSHKKKQVNSAYFKFH